MIISASRRTDIPAFFSDWFFNRIKEGYCCVRNPMYPQQVSKINLSKEFVDCIVFWTKNPLPMLDRLDEIADYNYYFQFTLTGYGKDMERNLPDKKKILIPTFQKLSEKLGKKRVIWRYDPILFNDRYTPDYHIKAFTQIAEALNGYTEKCVISFVDIYAKNQENMKSAGIYELSNDRLLKFAKMISDIADKNGIKVVTCAEKIDLKECGIEHNCCIDKNLIEEILGCKLNGTKDKSQRQECGCMESIEIGVYNTCKNGCRYCYANHKQTNISNYNPDSPLLCGKITNQDIVTERKVKSLKKGKKNDN